MTNIEYNLTQPWKTLDPWQHEYIFKTDPNVNCFLLCPRQTGKTTAMAIRAVELCVNSFKAEQNILICSITEKQAYRMLAKALVYAKIKYPKILIQKGKDKPTMHRILFKDGKGQRGIYCFAAGETGEGLRGDTIKKLMVDEGSRMSEEFFIATLPMLSVAKGSIDIASTPHGTKDKEGNETFFYRCSKDDNYKKFYVNVEDCPRHSKEFLDNQREVLGKLAFAQEYEAKFLDELKQLFSWDWINKICTLKRPTAITQNRFTFLGADIAGFGGDEITLEIVEKIDREKIYQVESIVKKNQMTTETTADILHLENFYNFNQIGIDDGGLGFGVWSELMSNNKTKRKTIALNNSSRKIDKEGVKSKRVLKEEMYTTMLILGEQNKLKLLDDKEIKASLASIQYDGDKIFSSYAHIVEGLVRAVFLANQKHLNFFISYI